MLNIRKATIDDIDILYDLIVGIAKHHNQEQYLLTTKESLVNDGFGASPKFGILLAEYHGEVAGYVSYTINYSIWAGANYLNIDDLFVWGNYRGKKIGEFLMLRVKEICKEDGIDRVRWEVQGDNLGAIKFYERLGAQMTNKGIFRWAIA